MSRTPRLFLEQDRFSITVGTQIPLLPKEQRYLLQVLRLTHKTQVTLLDGQGHAVQALLLLEGLSIPVFHVEAVTFIPSVSKPKVTLIQGLIKHDKMEWVIQKATELGVSQIIPVACERSVVQLEEKRALQRISRWNEIAKQAAQQSKRLSVPMVSSIVSFPELVLHKHLQTASQTHSTIKILFWEESLGFSLHDVFNETGSRVCKEIFLFIGPEGGFSEKEVQLAKEAGWQICTLGHSILRAETAALCALSIVRYLLDD